MFLLDTTILPYIRYVNKEPEQYMPGWKQSVGSVYGLTFDTIFPDGAQKVPQDGRISTAVLHNHQSLFEKDDSKIQILKAELDMKWC